MKHLHTKIDGGRDDQTEMIQVVLVAQLMYWVWKNHSHEKNDFSPSLIKILNDSIHIYQDCYLLAWVGCVCVCYCLRVSQTDNST